MVTFMFYILTTKKSKVTAFSSSSTYASLPRGLPVIHAFTFVSSFILCGFLSLSLSPRICSVSMKQASQGGDDDGELSERLLLTRSRQYDVALLFEAPLSQCSLRSLGSALQNCASLAVLDVSRNHLVSLHGVESVAGTLSHLNASDNRIADVAALATCTQLTALHLEGNQIQERGAVQTIAQLPRLTEVWLRREITLDDGDSLVLDNPICSNEETYQAVCAELLPRVRSVDGVALRSAKTRPGGQPTTAVSHSGAIGQACTKRLETMTKTALANVPEEAELLQLLKTAEREAQRA